MRMESAVSRAWCCGLAVIALTASLSAQGGRTMPRPPDARAGNGRARGAPRATSPLSSRPHLAARRLTPFFGAVYGAPALWWNGGWPPVTDEGGEAPVVLAEPVGVPPSRAAYAEPSSIQPLKTAAPAHSRATGSTGTLRLDVQPPNAQVYVDGFFAGSVDALNARGGLAATAGWHRLELRAPGYQTPAVNVTVEAGRIAIFQIHLRPLR
jgi:hypothetical protein